MGATSFRSTGPGSAVWEREVLDARLLLLRMIVADPYSASVDVRHLEQDAGDQETLRHLDFGPPRGLPQAPTPEETALSETFGAHEVH